MRQSDLLLVTRARADLKSGAVRELRVACGLTQTEIAAQVGVSSVAVSRGKPATAHPAVLLHCATPVCLMPCRRQAPRDHDRRDPSRPPFLHRARGCPGARARPADTSQGHRGWQLPRGARAQHCARRRGPLFALASLEDDAADDFPRSVSGFSLACARRTCGSAPSAVRASESGNSRDPTMRRHPARGRAGWMQD